MFLLDERLQYLYGTQPEGEALHAIFAENEDMLPACLDAVATYEVDGCRYIVSARRIETLNLYLVAAMSETAVLGNLIQSRMMYIYIFVLGILVLLVVARSMTSIMLKRLRTTIHAVKEIQGGDFNIHISEEGNDEFSELAINVNLMAQKIDTMINSIFLYEIEQKTSELKALQAQINPHFLFNVFEQIKMIAELHGQEEISDILTSVGSIVRYNLSLGDTVVTLGNELDNVKEYMKIQHGLCGGKLSVRYDVDPRALALEVPNLILQPIVENAIKHGFSSKNDALQVYIKIACEEDTVFCYISDDGRGMDAERLRVMLEKLADRPVFSRDKDAELGLLNVSRRLKLFFGSEYGIDMESCAQIGTIVTLKMPLSAQGKKEVV